MDGGAQQRMREPDRVVVPQQVRADELVPGAVGRVDGDRGERRRERQRGVLEHRDGERERLCVGRHRAEPAQHRSPERPRGGRRRRGEGAGVRAPSLIRERGQQLADLERVAPGELEAPQAEGVVGIPAAAADERADGRGPERRGRQDPQRRIGRQGREQPAGPRLARPDRDDDRDRLVRDAADEIGQQPQGGLVGPVRVVDEHHGGCALRDAQHDPVQRMQDCEPGRVRRARRGVPGIHDGAGGRGRTGEEVLAVRRRQRGDRPLQQRPRDAPSELALELVAARTDDIEPGLARQMGGVCEERGLAEPGRGLDEHRPAVPGGGAREQIGQSCCLGVALEQRLVRLRGGVHGHRPSIPPLCHRMSIPGHPVRPSGEPSERGGLS